MHRGNNKHSGEKSKDFMGAIKRLLSEIRGGLLALLIISIVFAILGSAISIAAPGQLSKLTDVISDGIKPDKEALVELSHAAEANMQNIRIEDIQAEILAAKTNNPELANELTGFLGALAKLEKVNENNKKQLSAKVIKALAELSPEAKNIIIPSLEFRGEKISGLAQADFFNLALQFSMANPNNESVDISSIAHRIDELPEEIRNFVIPKMDLHRVKELTILLIVLFVTYALVSLIGGLAITQVTNVFAQQLRRRISKKINRLPLKYFDSNQTGDILSRITNDVDTVSQSLDQSLATIVSALAMFFGTVFMMFKTNWIMSIAAIGASLLGFLLMFAILGKSQKYFIMRQKELGKLNAHIEEVYSGLNVVKAYNAKDEVDRRFDHYNQRVLEANRKSQFLSGLMNPIMTFIGNFGYVAVCVVGAILTAKGHISFGVIIAFISYVRLFTNPLAQMAQAGTSMQSAAAASERVFEFLDEKEMSTQDEISRKLKRKDVKGNIEFRNVKFGYDDDKLIIKDFSAKAKAGQKIAIVGPTGAGKTTMVNLLMKFYDINDGEIYIDNTPCSELSRENIHSLFTMVLQDTWMFQGSLRDNIIYNRKHVSDKKLEEICNEIGLTHFVKTLPHGFDTEVSENDGISAGQKQLITIARGMVEDSPFLILDEATSNVDTRTEELVQNAMDKLMEGRTSFVIAHRLSTIKNADLILVMKDGNIIESGKHDELMKAKGFYADLYNSQFAL